MHRVVRVFVSELFCDYAAVVLPRIVFLLLEGGVFRRFSPKKFMTILDVSGGLGLNEGCIDPGSHLYSDICYRHSARDRSRIDSRCYLYGYICHCCGAGN